jgi:hypothetical protein
MARRHQGSLVGADRVRDIPDVEGSRITGKCCLKQRGITGNALQSVESSPYVMTVGDRRSQCLDGLVLETLAIAALGVNP